MSLYVVVRPGTGDILGENYSNNFETMKPEAVRLGGVVCSTSFLLRRYNVRTKYGMKFLPGPSLREGMAKTKDYLNRQIAIVRKERATHG